MFLDGPVFVQRQLGPRLFTRCHRFPRPINAWSRFSFSSDAYWLLAEISRRINPSSDWMGGFSLAVNRAEWCLPVEIRRGGCMCHNRRLIDSVWLPFSHLSYCFPLRFTVGFFSLLFFHLFSHSILLFLYALSVGVSDEGRKGSIRHRGCWECRCVCACVCVPWHWAASHWCTGDPSCLSVTTADMHEWSYKC